VTRARDGGVARNEVNLVVLPPAEMVSALAGKSIAGFIVAEPFNAAAETAGVGKVLRLSGDVWKNHACCVTFLAERDIAERPEWAQRVTNAIVKAQLWTRGNQLEAAKLLSSADDNRYTPHSPQVLAKVLATTDYRQLRGQRRRPQQGLAAAAHRLPALSLPVLHRGAGAGAAKDEGWRATTPSCKSSIRALPPATWWMTAS
jgi:ABC-type nitrate/sulfonate/bicarbonate transport system substrate-binding protein